MAYSRSNNPWNNTRQDTGWGLIFRLNLLMGKIEHDVENGDLEKWNLHLDRIYVNIHYKRPEEFLYDGKGRIVDIKFSKEDIEVFSRFAQKIEDVRKKIKIAEAFEDDFEKAKDLNQLRVELYSLIFKKDIWIRKKMFELKLYLKETEHDPRKAIYGG